MQGLPFPETSLLVRWVVEQDSQFDAAMAVLWEVGRTWVSRIQIGSCVIGWEQYQRAQKVQQVKRVSLIPRAEEVRKGISRRLALATVTQDHFEQIDAAAVMTQ